MSADIKRAIESLYEELKKLDMRGTEIKKNINSLSAVVGEPPPFSDLGASSFVGMATDIRPDQFFGKALTASVREYLRLRGRASTAEEIFEALKRGGFEFSGNEKFWLKNLAISLSKNRNDFVYVKSSNAYGLWEFYPEKQKEKESRERQKILDDIEETMSQKDEGKKETPKG